MPPVVNAQRHCQARKRSLNSQAPRSEFCGSHSSQMKAGGPVTAKARANSAVPDQEPAGQIRVCGAKAAGSSGAPLASSSAEAAARQRVRGESSNCSGAAWRSKSCSGGRATPRAASACVSGRACRWACHWRRRLGLLQSVRPLDGEPVCSAGVGRPAGCHTSSVSLCQPDGVRTRRKARGGAAALEEMTSFQRHCALPLRRSSRLTDQLVLSPSQAAWRGRPVSTRKVCSSSHRRPSADWRMQRQTIKPHISNSASSGASHHSSRHLMCAMTMTIATMPASSAP